MNNNCFDISVAVLTYYPDEHKLYRTLMSILSQKNISFQIIVSDDGSENNFFDEIEAFFKKNNFENFKLVSNKINVGTVKNVIGAVRASDGQYVKLISPGDLLYSENTLCNWLSHVRQNNAQWSFGDAVYYNGSSANTEIIEAAAHPKIKSPYLKNNSSKYRKKYLINNDICLGAATLCEKNTLLKYLEMIDNKVVYAEDNIYRIMMFENVSFIYVPFNVIFYEYGTGVSTSGNSEWNKKIRKDWDNTTDIILNINKLSDNNQKAILKAIKINLMPNSIKKKIKSLFITEKLLFEFEKRFCSQKTSKVLSDDALTDILYVEENKCRL